MTTDPRYPSLTFRQDYFDDPAAWAALVSLLQDTFGIDLDPLRRLGGADPTSMPFGWFDDQGTLVANLSAFAMPIVINGRVVRAGAFQSGAVRPEWRGRGLYGDVTRKALEWCAAQQFEAIVLYTDKPALYEPYGFRALPFHAYSGPAPEAPTSTAAARSLDPTVAEDLDLLRRTLRTRTPVSDVIAVRESAAMFLINTQFDRDVRLSWLANERAVIAWKSEAEDRFVLVDVVAEVIPPLSAILGGLGIEATSIEVLFSPDKLGCELLAQPLQSYTHFMIRCETPFVLDVPAMLSPMADF
ncbi:acetyltransferase [Rhizobium sp. Root708]|uniref:GNAT family N-acetyltransferase n=1 Tax=Rhizobium sp. Root708 TaxID=1736592 RepID=UPI0006F55DAD|nr:GNAT family N-acetyltransferase [Rhizobium sp. Root708]KRB58700.1 acetyltransferase [Rhizobium sp. Root708]